MGTVFALALAGFCLTLSDIETGLDGDFINMKALILPLITGFSKGRMSGWGGVWD